MREKVVKIKNSADGADDDRNLGMSGIDSR